MSEAIYTWDMSGLLVLIPKKRGEGYLKIPIGHHHIQPLADMEYSEEADFCGLDGYLSIAYGYTENKQRKEIIDRVMPKLADYYKFQSWREDRSEFWRVLQPAAQAIDKGEG